MIRELDARPIEGVPGGEVQLVWDDRDNNVFIVLWANGDQISNNVPDDCALEAFYHPALFFPLGVMDAFLNTCVQAAA